METSRPAGNDDDYFVFAKNEVIVTSLAVDGGVFRFLSDLLDPEAAVRGVDGVVLAIGNVDRADGGVDIDLKSSFTVNNRSTASRKSPLQLASADLAF